MRPKTFDQFIGQEKVVTRLKSAIEGSKSRNEAVPHVLLYGGGPGIGKTTLASIIADERGVEFKDYVAASFRQPKDLASVFVNVPENSIVFLDEIHRLPKQMQESIYSVMEDFKITIQASANKVVTIPIKPFTLVAATTDVGKLTQPLKTRFQISCHLEEYTKEEMEQILEFHAKDLGVTIDGEAKAELAEISRGIPRVGRNFISACRDMNKSITLDVVKKIKDLENIGPYNLNKGEIDYLCNFYKNFTIGPIGVASIVSTLGVDKDFLDEIETHLVKEGFVVRSPKGRILEAKSVKLAQELLEND